MLLLLLGCFAALRKQYLCLVSDGPSLLQSWCPDSNGTWHFYLMGAFKIINNTPTSLDKNKLIYPAFQAKYFAVSLSLNLWLFTFLVHVVYWLRISVTPAKPTGPAHSRVRRSSEVCSMHWDSQHQGWFGFWWLIFGCSEFWIFGCSELGISARPVKIWESLHLVQNWSL